MKDIIAPVNALRLMADAGQALIKRPRGMPGIGVITGEVGRGKTTAATWYANEIDATCVRAIATWTPGSMLAAISHELDAAPARTCARMVDNICESQAKRDQPRPIFIDEADHIITSRKLVESLRDLHDLTGAPLILIGMAGFRAGVRNYPQLASRVAHWVDFKRATIEDAQVLAHHCYEVSIEPELLEALYARTHGSLRELRTGMYQIEKLARAEGLDMVTREQWGDRPFTFMAEGND